LRFSLSFSMWMQVGAGGFWGGLILSTGHYTAFRLCPILESQHDNAAGVNFF